jgi:hypothetical protein
VPGTNSGLTPDDSTLVAAFRSTLLHQGAIALIVVAWLCSSGRRPVDGRLTASAATAASNAADADGTAARSF